MQHSLTKTALTPSTITTVENSLSAFRSFATKLDIPTTAFENQGFIKQLELTAPKQQLAIVEQIQVLGELFAFAASSSDVEKDQDLEIYCVQRALWKYGLVSKMDLSEIIEKDEVIEVYSTSQLQIYRNLYFFKLCSYSLFDIMSREWFELYDRPEFITRQLMGEVEETFRKDTLHTCSLPAHLMTEKLSSSEGRSFLTNFKKMLPLYNEAGGPSAFLVTIDAKMNLGN